MRARRNFGHDAAVGRVGGDLADNLVGEYYARPVGSHLDDGGGGLITGRFNSQNAHRPNLPPFESKPRRGLKSVSIRLARPATGFIAGFRRPKRARSLSHRAMTIAVFRAEGDAAASVARLTELGFAAALAPVLAPLALAALTPDGWFDAAAATSAKALDFASPSLRTRLRELPLHVVGAAGRQAAERLHLNLAGEAPDAASLANQLASRLPPRARLLYIAAVDRKPAFEAVLGGAGIEVTTVEVYVATARASLVGERGRGCRKSGRRAPLFPPQRRTRDAAGARVRAGRDLARTCAYRHLRRRCGAAARGAHPRNPCRDFA